MNVDADRPGNNKVHIDPIVTDTLDSESGIPRVNGIDYLQDVNDVVQDIINLFNTVLENLERSLSGYSNSSSSPGPEGIVPSFSGAKGGNVHPTEPAYAANGIPKEISRAAYEFLSKFRFLVNYTERRIKVSPTEKQEQDRKLRHAVRSSRKTELDIKSLNDALTAQRMEHKKSIDKLSQELNECQNASNQKTRKIQNDIERIVNESEIKMVKFYKESIVRQDLLNSEIKDREISLNDLRRNNILMENELRDKRRRVEIRLLECLAKYDEDIGGRHREMENLSKEFKQLNSQRKTLEEDMIINLRKLHDNLQQEKAEALQMILNEKLEKFVKNRAAKVIQKAWRAYWERHCAKKKKKSRKK